ncbi:hypothetical protein [Streptomyces sp. NRRL F-5123]|uniref:hypothetical protein n=1 Tax=Streptomyces sp. NRRL F-5123 TaxID=1463856 RepID=UPI0004E13A79|nr:hypothetical protein [Streptomyces sp. NRRL F-5123]
MSQFEYFQFLGYRWNVVHAKTIAADLPVGTVDVRPFFASLGFVRIDADHVPHVDLTKPLILVRIAELGGAALLIDGWHRVARARRDGVSELPCVVLDTTQERTVRLLGGTVDDVPAPAPFAEQDIRAAVLGEITDHFTECREEQQTYAGLDITEVTHEQDGVVVHGYDRRSRRRFTATATARVTTEPGPAPTA